MSGIHAATETVTLPTDKQPAVRVIPMPFDANVHSDMFDGWIISRTDIARSVPAVVHANDHVTTIAVNSFVFKQPIYVGDLVSFYANVVKAERTSITVDVEVYAQCMRANDRHATVKVTEATPIYVTTNEIHKPRMPPPL